MPEPLGDIVLTLVGIPIMMFLIGLVFTALGKSGEVIWRTAFGMLIYQVLAIFLGLFGATSVLMGIFHQVSGLQRVALILGGLSMIVCGGLAFYFAHQRRETLREAHRAKRSALIRTRIEEASRVLDDAVERGTTDPEVYLEAIALQWHLNPPNGEPVKSLWAEYQKLTGVGDFDWRIVSPKLSELLKQLRKRGLRE